MVASPRWTALSASVRGASHEKTGQPNQDSVRSRNPGSGHEMLLMALADGHGSTRSFRSDKGSALAAECALRQLAKFVRRLGPDAPISKVRNQARMHVWKGLPQHKSTSDAMTYWLETVTAVGVRLEVDDTLTVIAPLGVDDLVGLRCRPTEFGRTQLKDYQGRIAQKRWRELWPRVRFVD